MNLTKVTASQGECKPDTSRGLQNITPKLQAEPYRKADRNQPVK